MGRDTAVCSAGMMVQEKVACCSADPGLIWGVGFSVPEAQGLVFVSKSFHQHAKARRFDNLDE